MEIINAVGRRKSAVARVYLRKGNGKFTVNNKEFKEYFTMPNFQMAILEPLTTVGMEGSYDVLVNVQGGGFKGQAEAVRLGIARCLVDINAELKPQLKQRINLLSRDPREVERKKSGRKKARKRFQFSKR